MVFPTQTRIRIFVNVPLQQQHRGTPAHEITEDMFWETQALERDSKGIRFTEGVATRLVQQILSALNVRWTKTVERPARRFGNTVDVHIAQEHVAYVVYLLQGADATCKPDKVHVHLWANLPRGIAEWQVDRDCPRILCTNDAVLVWRHNIGPHPVTGWSW